MIRSRNVLGLTGVTGSSQKNRATHSRCKVPQQVNSASCRQLGNYPETFEEVGRIGAGKSAVGGDLPPGLDRASIVVTRRLD
jgi:hypothetical protein